MSTHDRLRTPLFSYESGESYPAPFPNFPLPFAVTLDALSPTLSLLPSPPLAHLYRRRIREILLLPEGPTTSSTPCTSILYSASIAMRLVAVVVAGCFEQAPWEMEGNDEPPRSTVDD